MGESCSDTLHAAELSFLKSAAAERMPEYALTTHDNGHTAWAVLEPGDLATLPRFTICRIDPCIVVMVDDADARQFESVASLEDALVFARHAVREVTAKRNIHRPPEVVQ